MFSQRCIEQRKHVHAASDADADRCVGHDHCMDSFSLIEIEGLSILISFCDRQRNASAIRLGMIENRYT